MPGVHSGGTVVEVLLAAPVDDVLLDVLVVVAAGDGVQSHRQQPEPAMSLRFAVHPSPRQSPPGQSDSAQQGAPPLLPPMQVATPRSHASPGTHAAPAEQFAAVVHAASGSPAQCEKSSVASPQRG